MLKVEKNVDEAGLKKAYRKVAVKVHPDKNGCPKSTDAFKKVNAAMACLSDPEKRRVYDQVGNEQAFEQRESRGGAQQHRHSQEEFFTPEDLFNHFFFGGEIPRRHGHYRQQNPYHQQRRQR